MKRNHLFASAAIGAVLVVTLSVQAQPLSGGMHGGISSMQSARLGGGFGPTHSAVSSQTDLSASGRAGARVDGLGRVDQTAKTGMQEAGRDAGRAKADAVVAGRGAVGASESAGSKASDAALGTTRTAAGATAATSATAAGQSDSQVHSVAAAGTVAGGLSTTEVSRTKMETGHAKPSAGQPVTTTKPDSAGGPPHSSATHTGSPAPEPQNQGASRSGETARSAGSHGEIDANASAAVDASTH
jgi:hypothetical protein